MAIKQSITPVSSSQAAPDIQPLEVPKTLPVATVTPSPLPSPVASSMPFSNTRLNNIEASLTDLTARISALEKSTPASNVSSSRAPLYIPMGSTNTSWTNNDWTVLNEFQTIVNPDDYSGYSSMQLEVNLRLVDSLSTGYARLYNVNDSSAVSLSDISSTSSAFNLKSSSAFKLSGGSKTYKLQIKSPDRKDLFIQSARIKINF